MKMKEVIEKEDILKFSMTVMPEYSVKVMKSYFIQANEAVTLVSEQFKQKYQRLTYEIGKLNVPINNEQFLNWLYDNVCEDFTFSLPQNCETYIRGIVNDGVSKVINWMSANL